MRPRFGASESVSHEKHANALNWPASFASLPPSLPSSIALALLLRMEQGEYILQQTDRVRILEIRASRLDSSAAFLRGPTAAFFLSAPAAHPTQSKRGATGNPTRHLSQILRPCRLYQLSEATAPAGRGSYQSGTTDTQLPEKFLPCLKICGTPSFIISRRLSGTPPSPPPSCHPQPILTNTDLALAPHLLESWSSLPPCVPANQASRPRTSLPGLPMSPCPWT